MDKTVSARFSADETFDTTGSPVSNLYQSPFKFTGTLNKIEINLAPTNLSAEDQKQIDKLAKLLEQQRNSNARRHFILRPVTGEFASSADFTPNRINRGLTLHSNLFCPSSGSELLTCLELAAEDERSCTARFKRTPPEIEKKR